MRRAYNYINAKNSAANHDIIIMNELNNRVHTNLKTEIDADNSVTYRIDYKNEFPKTVIVHNKTNKNKYSKKTSRNLIEEHSDEQCNNEKKYQEECQTISIDFITDRDADSTDIELIDTNVDATDISDMSLRIEIDSFLIGLENRYTDQTPFKMWNRMYTIGLDIAVSSYSKKKVEKIIDREIQDSTIQLGDTLDEVRVYNKKKVVSYIQAGIKDGINSDYSDIYYKTLNGISLVDLDQKTPVSSHLGIMFSKYAESAHPLDLEQFYNVGVLIANKPFNRDKMVDRLGCLIEERSKDEVTDIQRKKREQLLECMNKGFMDSTNEKVRNAYDLNGKYNYNNSHRYRLRIRARIDGLLAKSRK